MKYKTLLLICVLSLAGVFTGCGKAPVTDGGVSYDAVQEEALSAYRDILQAAPAIAGEHEELSDASFDYDRNIEKFGNHYDLFALTDLDQDGIPELIAQSTVNFRWTPISVYTYADGAAVLLKDPMNPDSHGTFEQMSTANGAYSTYICEAKHIHSVWRGSTPVGEVEENSAYSLEGTSLIPVECTVGENEHTINFHDIAAANTAENISEIGSSY